MAEVFLNTIFTSISGRMGSVVFYLCNNRVFIRSYIKPRNPDTPAQRRNRGLFRNAMKAWQGLSSFDKDMFARRARRLGMTGHNLFISRYMSRNRASRAHDYGSGASEDSLRRMKEASGDISGRDIHSSRGVHHTFHLRCRSVTGSTAVQCMKDGDTARDFHPPG